MILSKKNRFLFIHIPKTGGTSLGRSIIPFLSSNDEYYGYDAGGEARSRKNRFLMNDDNSLLLPRKHSKMLQVKSMYENINFDQYFKFAIVRNPLDLFVSLYFFWTQTNQKWHPKKVEAIKKLTFKEFIFSKEHKVNQSSFLIDENNKLIVDKIIKLENIDEDLDTLNFQLGFNLNLGHHNKTHHNHFLDYYDDDTIEFIRNKWKTDFELFNY